MAHRSRNQRPNIGGESILLVDRFHPTCQARAEFLRKRSVDVDTAENLDEARFLFQPDRYDLVLLDVRRYLPGEALDFCRLIKDIDPGQRIAFLPGPPRYLSTNWPHELVLSDELSRHWQEAVSRAAA